jgi:hypothetical protein
MANPTKSERNTGIISLVGAAVVAISVFMPYVNAGSGIFSNNRTPFQFGSYSQFSSNGFEVLVGAALIALSGLRFLKVIYPKKGPNGFGLFISCVIAGYTVNDVWSTSGWSGPVRLAYGGAIGYVGVGIGAIALIVYVTTRNSDEPDNIPIPSPEATKAPPTRATYCHQCGVILNTEARFCASCGTAV